MDRIYLDHNSTTPMDPRVAKAIFACHQLQLANPASQHQSGQKARRRLESVRERVLKLMGALSTGMAADKLILTSGGTESNNLALLGLAGQEPGRILVSSIEHPSVFGPAEELVRRGFKVVSIPVDENGVCRLDEFLKLISEDTRLVSLMLANNETGVIQPVEDIAKICRESAVLFHCDATQAVGKIPVSFRNLDVDAMTFSAHKFYGPRGVGGLIFRSSAPPDPISWGGFQQMGIRPGTEDVATAVGMLTSLELSLEGLSRYDEVERLRDRLESDLIAHWDVVINGSGARRLPHTSNVSFPGIDRQAFLMAADMAGLDISTGSACASGSSEPSPALMAMGLPADVIGGSIRISLGVGNTEKEIDGSLLRMGQIVKVLRADK